MTSSIESRTQVRFRGRANIGWSELFPRYLLVEGDVRGRSALEIGTIDPRSLFRLHDAGASRVVGTSPTAAKFEPALFRGRRIELLAMESGRVDFDDHAFDAILVTDLSVELAANPRFLEELRRVLSPDGFGLIGFQASGRSLLELVDEESRVVLLEPHRLEEAVRSVFPEARLYRQAPFIGVAIQPEHMGAEEAAISLDPTLAGPEPRPSHIIALCGSGAPESPERTLVELSFVDFEAMSDALQARATRDLGRALFALKEAREAIERRDDSIRTIGSRLPGLRAAIEARVKRPALLETGGSSRATEGGVDQERLRAALVRLEEARDGLKARLAGLNADLEEERRRREASEERSRVLESSLMALREAHETRLRAPVWAADLRPDAHDTIIQRSDGDDETDALELEADDLRLRIEELESELDREREAARRAQAELAAELQASRARTKELDLEIERARARAVALEEQAARTQIPEPAGPDLESELQESERRVRQLERTTSLQEQRIEELRAELESQLLVRHSLGSDYRDAEARIAYLTRRLENQALERTEAVRHLEARLATVTDALGKVDLERDVVRARIGELEAETSRLAERAARAERELAQNRIDRSEEEKELSSGRRELDLARRAAHEKAEQATWLERALSERDAAIEKLKKEKVSAEADKRAVEMTAAHLAQEVDALRTKNQALAYERDTLATTSRMLFEEKDAAKGIARRTIEAEERATQLAVSLEGAQAAISRLERELKESRGREDSVAAKLETAQRDQASALAELSKTKALGVAEQRRAERAEGERTQAASRIVELDQQIAALEHRCAASEGARALAERTSRNLEEMLREATQDAHAAGRDLDFVSRRVVALEARAAEAEEEIARLLTLRMAEESARAGDRAALVDAEAHRAALAADLACARAEACAHVEAVATFQAEKAELERSLSRTLEEAAILSAYMRELELDADASAQALEQGERERLTIERQRNAAEEGREIAEEARAYLVAEMQVLQSRVVALEGEREQLLRDLDRFEQASLSMESQLGDAQARIEAAIEEGARWQNEASALHETVRVLERDPAARDGDGALRPLPVRDAGLDAENVRLALRLQESEAKLRRLEDDVLRSRGIVDERAIESRLLRVRLEAAEAELSRTRAELDEAVTMREASLASLRARLSSGDEAERIVSERAEASEARAVVAETLARAYEERLEDADARVLALEWRASDCEGRAQGAEARLERAEADLQAAQEKVETLLGDLTASAARLQEEEARRVAAEGRSDLLERRIAEAARSGGPLPGEELRRLAARATDAEERVLRAEQQAQHAQAALDQMSARAAQSEARALKGEERADRAEAAYRKTESRARQAEERATQHEVVIRELEQRLRDLETKHRQLEQQASGVGPAQALKARCESLEAAIAYRDGELRRMKGLSEETARELDEARADVGRRLAEIRSVQHALDFAKQELGHARVESEQLRTKLQRQGDADLLKIEVERREQEIARVAAEAAARSSETARLRVLVQQSEQAQVQLERRVAELEAALSDGNHRIELLKRDVAEKSERLRRLAELSES